MMRPCTKCFENNWHFEIIDDMVRATCQSCGYEVEFEKKQAKELTTGDSCRKCGLALILRESKFKPSKLKKDYYFTAYFWCSKCKAIYYAEGFKIRNPIPVRIKEL